MNIISGFRGPSPEGGADHNEGKTRPRRVRGQTVILVALSMVALLAIVGLAVDGGAMYAQRRNAQNSSDAAAIAATRNMLTIYMTNNGGDGTAADEQTISNTLASLAAAHGISRSNLHAYYVNDNKQVVGAAEVGYLGGVPFSQGAKGIAVKDRSETNAFFMKLFGWNQVGASADSTAFLGIATDEGNTMSDMDGIFPVGFFTNTDHLNNLVPGRVYTLIDQDPLVAGNWGYVGFNGNNTPHVNDAWQACGYNPGVHNATEWAQWCTNAHYSGEGSAAGPTLFNTGWPDITSGDLTSYSLHWGEGVDGWWIPGDQGKSTQQCHSLSNLVVGQQFLVPVFDDTVSNGNNSRFHLINLAWFTITHSEVDCNGDHLEIQGRFVQKYTSGASGHHGDITHTSMLTVFLDN